jgi:hypothetical protein
LIREVLHQKETWHHNSFRIAIKISTKWLIDKSGNVLFRSNFYQIPSEIAPENLKDRLLFFLAYVNIDLG